jgi:hypothetical protein
MAHQDSRRSKSWLAIQPLMSNQASGKVRLVSVDAVEVANLFHDVAMPRPLYFAGL